MKRQLIKALEIAALTGDKVIVVDEKTDKGMVVMGLEEYEKLLFEQKRAEFQDDDVDFENLEDEDDWIDDIVDEIPFDIPFDGAKKENESVFINTEKETEELVENTPVLNENKAVNEDENVYYYQESEEKTEEVKKEDSGFTSIKEELKERRKWEIPPSIKNSAEEIVGKN